MASDVVENGSPWYFYIRRVGINWKIGLVDKSGVAIDDGSQALKLYYEEIPDEINDDDSVIPLHKEFIYRFAKGCAYEYLLTEGIINKEFEKSYERGLRKARARVIKETKTPLQVKAITIVPKR